MLKEKPSKFSSRFFKNSVFLILDSFSSFSLFISSRRSSTSFCFDVRSFFALVISSIFSLKLSSDSLTSVSISSNFFNKISNSSFFDLISFSILSNFSSESLMYSSEVISRALSKASLLFISKIALLRSVISTDILEISLVTLVFSFLYFKSSFSLSSLLFCKEFILSSSASFFSFESEKELVIPFISETILSIRL